MGTDEKKNKESYKDESTINIEALPGQHLIDIIMRALAEYYCYPLDEDEYFAITFKFNGVNYRLDNEKYNKIIQELKSILRESDA